MNCVYFIMSEDGQKANTDVKALPTADCKQCNIIYTVFRMLLYTAMLWSQDLTVTAFCQEVSKWCWINMEVLITLYTYGKLA